MSQTNLTQFLKPGILLTIKQKFLGWHGGQIYKDIEVRVISIISENLIKVKEVDTSRILTVHTDTIQTIEGMTVHRILDAYKCK